MEFMEVNPQSFDNIQSFSDLETAGRTDNVTKVGKLLRKVGKSKVLAVATGGASKLASKKGRQEVKKVASKVGKTIIGTSVLLPLQPLRPVMIKGLKKEGVKADNKMQLVDLANLFYKHVVRKQDKSFEEIDINNLDDHAVGAALGAIVTGIISFIKKIKSKKKAGEALTKMEEVIAEGTEEVETQIESGAKEEIAQQVGTSLLFNKKTQMIVVGVIVVIIIIAVVIARKKS